jgi:hypothetical protein
MLLWSLLFPQTLWYSYCVPAIEKISVDGCLQFCFPTKESKAPSSSKDFYLASWEELNGYLAYLR